MKLLSDQGQKKINMLYQPSFFSSSSEINDILVDSEKKVIVVLRLPENQKQYEIFDNDFSLFLNKLPNSYLKDNVGKIFNKKIIYIGTAKNDNTTIYSRNLISKKNKLVGIILNGYALDISLKTGETPAIDESIYATYLSLVRASIILNKNEIIKDYELHKYVSSFIYILMLKILGKNISFIKQQKTLLQLVCTYLYHKQFVNESHNKVLKVLSREYVGDIFTREDIEKTYASHLDKLISFTSFKDFPRIIQTLNISSMSSSQITMLLIRFLGSNGFYTLIGSLDLLIASIILGKYPTEIVSRGFNIVPEIQDKLEKKINDYIQKIDIDHELEKINLK